MSTTASPTPAHAYTPLECLLLFQSLLTYGTRDEDFIRISDALTNNTLVKDVPTYEPQRLSIDALRQLYAQLLYEEVKADGLEQEVQEDGTQAGSKKRKIPSPTLPLLKDLSQYKDKLPLVVDRLYARYRDRMIQSIREDERRYALIQKEIQEIERGEWDERILEEDREVASRNNVIPSGSSHRTSNGTTSPAPPIPASTSQHPPSDPKPVQTPLPQSVPLVKPSPVLVQAKPSPKPSPSTPQLQLPASQAQPKPEGIPISNVLKTPQHQQEPNHQPPRPSPQLAEARPQNGPPPRPPPKRTPSNGQHVQQVPTGPPIQPQPQFQWHQEHPYPPPPQQQQQVQHPQFQPGTTQQQYSQQRPLQQPQQYGPPPRGNFPQPHGYPPPQQHVPSSPSPLNSQHPRPLDTQHSPQLNSHHQPQHGQPQHGQPQHGVLLPPINAMGRQPGPGSPGVPLDALADMAGQQYRAASASPMTSQAPQMHQPPQGYQMQPPPMAHQGHPIHPELPVQYPQQRPLSSGPPNGSAHVQPQQWSGPYPQYVPPQPPQFPPQYHQSPNPRSPFPAPQAMVQPPDNRPYNSPYNANQGPKPPVPAGTPAVSQPPPQHRPSLPSTPANQMVHRFFTGTDTEWTPTPTASTPRANQIVHPPPVEPISPIMRSAKPPSLVKSTPAKKDPRKPELIKSPTTKLEPIKVLKRGRGGQQTRAGSTTPSVVAGSRRSQSVASHMEDESASRQVKQEVATPIGVEDGGDTTADELSTFPARKPKRESTLLKRKRATTHDSFQPPGPPAQVLWTRNFPKISSSTLEGITAHKNASMFAAPIKERDAPGYKNVILRPQDLKHIRSSINAGNRAASAAAPADMNSSATNVWLPISEDLIPPKGIINNAQLETELMRMFANAIMFNADPDRGLGRRFSGKGQNGDDEEKGGEVLGYEIDEDGVVKDTRAMFSDVEKLITELRSAERRSEELRETSLNAVAAPTPVEESVDGEEVGDDASSVQGSVAKRRRKA